MFTITADARWQQAATQVGFPLHALESIPRLQFLSNAELVPK
jgi:hypothetical protein